MELGTTKNTARILNPANEVDYTALQVAAAQAAQGNKTLALEIADRGPNTTWTRVTLLASSLAAFPDESKLYRNISFVKLGASRPTTPTPPPPSQSVAAVHELRDAVEEQIAELTDSASAAIDAVRDENAEQTQKIAAHLRNQNKQIQELREHFEKQQTIYQRSVSDELHRLESLQASRARDHHEAIMKELSTLRAESTRYSVSPPPLKPGSDPSAPLVLGTTGGGGGTKANPYQVSSSAPHGTASQPIIISAAASAQRSLPGSASLPLWSTAPSMPRPPSATSPEAQAMEALVRRADDEDGIFSSHRINHRDVFTDEERAVLMEMPIFYLHKKEEGLADHKRAIQVIARFVIEYQGASITTIRDFFRTELRHLDAALSPESAYAVHESLMLFGDHAATRDTRLRALFSLAMAALKLDKHLYSSAPRLLIATLSAPPQTAAEANAWSKTGKRPIPPAPAVALPFRVGGF